MSVPVQVSHKDPSSIALTKNYKEGSEVCKVARSSVGMEMESDQPREDTGFYYVRLNTSSIKYRWVSVLVCSAKPVLYLLPDPMSSDTYTVVIDEPSEYENNEKGVKVPVKIVEQEPIPCSESKTFSCE